MRAKRMANGPITSRLFLLIVIAQTGCLSTTHKASFQERLECRAMCKGSMKNVERSDLGWVLCDCRDGTRYRISKWDEEIEL